MTEAPYLDFMSSATKPKHGSAYYMLSPPHALEVEQLPKPTAVDLFSGAGGLTLGLLNAHFDVLLSSDLSKACALTHRHNLPTIPFFNADVADLSASDIFLTTGLRRGELDMLVGGPPCQGFSIIGQRVLDDPRNRLFGDFIRLAGELRPKVAVIENVPGLATLGKGVLLREIGAAFRSLGYNAHCAELLAAQYGVPQMRWRMFFIAWRDDLGIEGAGFPSPSHGSLGVGDLVPNRTVRPEQSDGFITIEEAISDLPPIESGGAANAYSRPPTGAYQTAMRSFVGSELHNHHAPRMSPLNIQRIKALQPGQDWRDLPRELLPPGMQRAHRKDHTRRYRRMSWEGIARSIITRFRDPKSGEYIHPAQTRTISIREAARIQSFPDWFEFKGSRSDQYDQIGNAVPPLLAKAVGLELGCALARSTGAVPVKSRYTMYA